MAGRPIVTFVVAVAENDVMGAGNQLPWHLPADLKKFKELTMGRPMIMGRKTYDSIGRPLPGRTSIVVTRQAGLELPGCIVVDSVERALEAAGDVPEIAVIGGAEIYRQLLARVDIIHLTRVHAEVEGDTLFPELDPSEWDVKPVSYHAADERHAYAFTLLELTRKSAATPPAQVPS